MQFLSQVCVWHQIGPLGVTFVFWVTYSFKTAKRNECWIVLLVKC